VYTGSLIARSSELWISFNTEKTLERSTYNFRIIT
jgi:hypothetical protein